MNIVMHSNNCGCCTICEQLLSFCLCPQTSSVCPSWMKVAELGGFYWKWKWAPPRPSNRVPFTVIQGKAVVAERTRDDCKLAVVDVATQKQSSLRLPEFLGIVCALERCEATCYAITSLNRRFGIHKYFLSLNKWEHVDDIPGGHVFLAVSVTTSGKYLYIIGSTRVHEAISIVLSFNTESRQWKRLPDLQMSVMFPSLVVANNRLIVTGSVSSGIGSECDEFFSVVLKHQMKSLLLSSQQWIQVGSTIEWSPRLNVIHNLVVATGGLKRGMESIAFTRNERSIAFSPTDVSAGNLTEGLCMRLLDPRTKQWLPLPPPQVGSDSIAQYSTCVTEQQTLMVLTQTRKDDRCMMYEMDIPCDMSSDPV